MSQNSGLMQGKRGVILGVANNRSIAWGIAKACHAAGAEIALTWQGDALKKRVEPLARELDGILLGHCDVTDPATIDAVFDVLREKWGKIDFVVHAIAFSDKDQLDGRYLETTADNFSKTMLISCYSLTAIAQRAEKLLTDGGSILTLTYYGAEKWMPHYNVMGVAKGGAGGERALSRRRSRREEHPRQRDFGGADQDAGGVRHRRFPLHPEMERIQRADAPHRDHRGSRRQRAVSAVGPVARRHRRGASRRFRLSRRRHEAPRRAGYFAERKTCPARNSQSSWSLPASSTTSATAKPRGIAANRVECRRAQRRIFRSTISGRKQAANAGGILADLFARDGRSEASLAFVASPLGRARLDDGAGARRLKLPPDDYAIDDRLREIGYGHWEGSTLAQMQAPDPDVLPARPTNGRCRRRAARAMPRCRPGCATGTISSRPTPSRWPMAAPRGR